MHLSRVITLLRVHRVLEDSRSFSSPMEFEAPTWHNEKARICEVKNAFSVASRSHPRIGRQNKNEANRDFGIASWSTNTLRSELKNLTSLGKTQKPENSCNGNITLSTIQDRNENSSLGDCGRLLLAHEISCKMPLPT